MSETVYRNHRQDMTRIAIKRVYEPATDTDGLRVLVDKLWPRGIRKEALHYDLWAKEIAPSAPLRRWFHADPRSRCNRTFTLDSVRFMICAISANDRSSS